MRANPDLEVGLALAGRRDLGYALKLLAAGQTVKEAWKEAGFASRKDLADSLFDLAGKTGTGGGLRLVAYADGASIGNPGDAGCGALIADEEGRELAEDYRYLGKATNNVAEYQGAILALSKAHQLGGREVELRVDSSLLANQITGRYKVKNPALAVLYQDLKKQMQLFDKVTVTLIGRSANRQADRLASLAISAHRGGESGVG
jgi:ribonuclease HI